MLDFIYAITIYPFEVSLQFLFELIQSYTQVYGLSIIILSLIVNIALLPLYHLAEKWQSTEREFQAQMKPKAIEIKNTYAGYERHAFLSALYRQHRYKPIYALKSAGGLLIQIPLFLAAYQFLSNYVPIQGQSFAFLADLGGPDKLINTSIGSINVLPFVMTAVNLFSVYIYIKGKGSKETIQQYCIAAVFLIALYNSASALLLYWTISNSFSLVKNIVYRLISSRVNPTESVKNELYSVSNQFSNKLYWVGLFLSLFSIFISAPLGLLESGSIGDFDQNLMFYMQPLIGTSIAILFAAAMLHILLPKKVVLILGLILSYISISIVTNHFVFHGEYGDMSNFVFENGYWIDIDESHKNIFYLFLLFLLFSYIVKVKRYNFLVRSLNVCLLASLALASINAYQFYLKRALPNLQAEMDGNNLFTLTKNGRNVVIIMMDRMVAGYIPNSLELIPDLRKTLEGFTWYPRTLSPGTYTVVGVPSIAGGYDYLSTVVNNDTSNQLLSERVDESFRVLPYNFEQAGFATSLIQPSSLFNPANSEYLENTSVFQPNNTYHKYWRQKNDLSFNKTRVHSKLAYFGLFRSVPVALRDDIYSQGAWQPFNKNNVFTQTRKSLREAGILSRTSYYGDVNSPQITDAIKSWAIMDDLPLLSNITDDDKDQFYYFSNELTHEPWATKPDLGISLGKPVTFSREDIANFKTLSSVQHLYTVAATMKHIADWINWLKENNVYDNTRIIIASDHGRNVFNPMFSKQKFASQGLLSEVENHVSWFHSTLMVKDFNSTSEFKTSDKFMTSADVPWLSLEGIAEGINPYTNNKIKEPTNKLPWVGVYTPWRLEDNLKSKYKVNNYFIINNPDIFDVDNWQDQGIETSLPTFSPLIN